MDSPLKPSVVPKPSDEDLMQAIVERDQDALTRLYERHRALLGKIIAEILSADSDTQETLQDVFTEVWRRADSYDPAKGKAQGWLITMARRRAIDRYRKVLRHSAGGEKLRKASAEVPGSVAGVAVEESSGGPNREVDATTNDLRALLTHALGSLPATQAQVIYLTYFEDLSQRAVSARTGIPLGTVKTRLDLALRKLAIKCDGLRAEIQYAN